MKAEAVGSKCFHAVSKSFMYRGLRIDSSSRSDLSKPDRITAMNRLSMIMAKISMKDMKYR